MELLTVGCSGRSLPQLVQLLGDHDVRRPVDVRERPYSRKMGSPPCLRPRLCAKACQIVYYRMADEHIRHLLAEGIGHAAEESE